MYFYGGYSSYIIFVLPAIILTMYAQTNVNSTFNKYSKVGNRRGLTAYEVARKILDLNGLYNVSIESISGKLTDHFDPRANVIRLSDSTRNSTSVAAIGVAAHEVGHAVQYAKGYMPIKLRNAIVPVVQFSSYLAWPLVLIGLVLSAPALAEFGVILFTFVVAFQLITLPVEFNASSRAIKTLNSEMILDDEETKSAKKVLKAAALTYVASAAVAIGNLLRLLVLTGRSNRD